MKYSVAIFAFVAAISAQASTPSIDSTGTFVGKSITSRQSTSGLTACGQDCVSNVESSAECTNSNAGFLECLCSKGPETLAACLVATCSSSEALADVTLIGNICVAAGTPITWPSSSPVSTAPVKPSATPVKSNSATVESSATPMKSSITLIKSSAVASPSVYYPSEVTHKVLSSSTPAYTLASTDACAVVTVTTTIMAAPYPSSQ